MKKMALIGCLSFFSVLSSDSTLDKEVAANKAVATDQHEKMAVGHSGRILDVPVKGDKDTTVEEQESAPTKNIMTPALKLTYSDFIQLVEDLYYQLNELYAASWIDREDLTSVSEAELAELQGFMAAKIYRLIRKNSAAVLKDLGTPVEISFPSNPNEPIFFDVKITTKDGQEKVKVIAILPNTFLGCDKNIDDALMELYANRDKHGYTYAQQKLVLSDTLLARLMNKHIDQKLESAAQATLQSTSTPVTTDSNAIVATCAVGSSFDILPGTNLGNGYFYNGKPLTLDSSTEKENQRVSTRVGDYTAPITPSLQRISIKKPVAIRATPIKPVKQLNVNAKPFIPKQ